MDEITWPSEFLEFLRSCTRHGAKTLVFGGFAVSPHARPRTTGDLNLWCGLDATNWERIKAALVEFGFEKSRIALLDAPRPNVMLRFGYEPIRIELFTSVADLDFDHAWDSRYTLYDAGLEITFLDRESLIRSKIAAGRPQDLADLEQLRRCEPTSNEPPANKSKSSE